MNINKLTKKEKLINYMYFLSRIFDRSKAPKKGITIQFCFTEHDQDYNFFLIADKNECSYTEGFANKPKLTVQSTFDDWKKISGKILSPLYALKSKRLIFKGSFFTLLKLGSFFTGSIDYIPPKKIYTKNAKTKDTIQEIKKVLVISGAPRKDKGTTHFFTNKFVDGIKQCNTDVEWINISDYKIIPCVGCYDCYFGDRTCRFKNDDFNKLFDKFIKSDLVIFATPIYTWSWSSQMKTFIDRLFIMSTPELFIRKGEKRITHGYKYPSFPMLAVVATCGLPYMDVFNPLKEILNNFSKLYQISLIGQIYIPSAMTYLMTASHNKDVYKLFDSLTIAGQEIIKYKKITKKTQKILNKNIFNDKILISGGNAFMELIGAKNKRPDIDIMQW